MIHLFDTDTAILMMRGLSITEPRTEKQRQRQEVGRRILAACRRHAARGEVIGLSAITIAELEFGACEADDPEAERARMQRVLGPFARFDFGANEPTRHYGEVRSKLESQGQVIGPTIF